MSINSFIGFIAAFGLFIWSITLSTSNFMVFVSVSSFILVVGGTLAATFLGQEARYVGIGLKAIGSIFLPQRVGRNILNKEVGRIITWGYQAQKEGVVALDAELKKVSKDPFLTFGMEMILSGYAGDDVKENLYRMVDSTYERNTIPAEILKSMAGTAPAFGMIGTLIGLIVMLDTMGSDAGELGKGLAVALNTTLYGVIIARMIFLPAATKLIQRHQINRFRMELLAEGLAMLADRKNPRYIQDRMNSFLDPSIHYDIDKQLKK